jgi:enamine deaminase RidA (YjgF/YER057c/UK114 family)
MVKKVVYTDRLMRPIAHFSHAARIGEVIHVGATAGVFPDLRLAGDSVGRVDMAAQTRKMFENLGTALELMGSTLSEVARLKTYVADPRDIPLYLKSFAEHFPSMPPAHSVVGSWSFPLPQAAVELDAVAISGRDMGGSAGGERSTGIAGRAATMRIHYATALPIDAAGQVTRATGTEQIAAALRNLEAMLADQGLVARDVCNLHVTLADARACTDVRRRLATFFAGQLPSCTFVEAPLERPDFEISLETAAVRGGGRPIGCEASRLGEGQPAPAVLAGDMLFLSGQTGTRAGSTASAHVESQTRTAFARLHALVEAAGFGADSIVRTNNVLTDWRHYAGFNAGYGACIEEPYVPRATVLGKLVDPRAKVQIEGIAHRFGCDATILQVAPPAAR